MFNMKSVAVLCLLGYLGATELASGFTTTSGNVQRTSLPQTRVPLTTFSSPPSPVVNRHHGSHSNYIPNMSTRSNDSELKASTVIHSQVLDDPQGRSRRRIDQWGAAAAKMRSVATKLMHNLRTDEVTQWRCAAVLFVSSLFVLHSRIDVGLAKLWTYLTTSSGLWARWFRHDRRYNIT
jgi:hypothetical protein